MQCKNLFTFRNGIQEFIESLNDENLKEKLEIALDGRGAFRRFKNVLFDYSKERNGSNSEIKIKKAVLEWCKENEIEYEEEAK